MHKIQEAFKKYRIRIGAAPEKEGWVPDTESVTYKHFEAGWHAGKQDLCEEMGSEEENWDDLLG